MMAPKPKSLPGRLVSLSIVSSEGSILIIALWTLTILTIFAANLGYGVRQKIILVQRLEERDKLHFIAEAGVRAVIAQLKEDSEDSEEDYDALNDAWGSYVSQEVGDGKVDFCYDYIDDQTNSSMTRAGIMDERSKLNINRIDQPVLERFFALVLDFDEVEVQELAASIVDWRDKDSELSIPVGSAEDAYYEGLQCSYGAKDADFEVLDELLLVKGMSLDIFNKVRNYLTIYDDGKVNINTASKIVLLALGLNENIVEKILSYRLGEDGVIGTADDNIFTVASDIVTQLDQFSNLSEPEKVQLIQIQDKYLVTNSNSFMIRGIAKLNDRQDSAVIVCIANRLGKILYWQEL